MPNSKEEELKQYLQEMAKQLEETQATTERVYALQVVQALLLTSNMPTLGALAHECKGFIHDEANRVLQEWRTTRDGGKGH